jgi:3-methyladenine DNA glycosylase/8-oxoguanine DNA glycosylase
MPAEPDHSEAVEHLRAADLVMAGIIEQVGPCMLGSSADRGGPAHDHYGALLRAIVGQQLSVSAARSI